MNQASIHDYPLRTWTVFFDYGGAPLVWTQEGRAKSRGVGGLELHAQDMADIVPDPMGAQFDELGCTFESDSTMGEKIDWLTFQQEALRLTALLALWVAQFNILVRYSFPYEDGRFPGYDSQVWMTPDVVARLATGQPDLQDDVDSWNYLLGLHEMGSIQELGGAAIEANGTRGSPTPEGLHQGCVSP